LRSQPTTGWLRKHSGMTMALSNTIASEAADTPRRSIALVGNLVTMTGTFLATLLGLLIMTFTIGRVMPIDPVSAIVGWEADKATYDRVYHELAFDQPLYVQFLRYLSGILHGDFGIALRTGRPVLQDILAVFPATAELATLSILVGAAIGIPLGVYAAARQGKLVDNIARFVTLVGYSTPNFWLALVGLLVFYGWLGWAGGSGRVSVYLEGLVPVRTGSLLIDSLLAGDTEVFFSALRHIFLPASVMAYGSMAFITRMTRSFMLDQLSQEYVTTARVKGLSENKILWRHAFPNIGVQLLTILALVYGGAVEGSVLVETVFAWPGFGQYLTNNLLMGDMNAAMGCVLLVGVIFVTLNFISDFLYRVLDPRTK
jgi:peptide/nickel transport system permease protein